MKGFDSVGELHFSYWTDQLIQEGYIEQVVLQPEPYDLSMRLVKPYIKKMKRVEDKKMYQTIHQPHIYTPDVLIVWTEKARGIFFITIKDTCKVLPHHLFANWQGFENRDVWATTLELKPTFDHQNMTRLASLNIKWVYEKYNHIIEMVKVPDFFKKTFTPDRYLLTDKTYVPRKLKYEPKNLTRFISELQKQKADK
jgi:hypothetical protein